MQMSARSTGDRKDFDSSSMVVIADRSEIPSVLQICTVKKHKCKWQIVYFEHSELTFLHNEFGIGIRILSCASY